MADGKIVIETGIDTSGIESGISQIAKLTTTGLKTATAAIGAVSTALMGAGGYAVKVGSDFEAAMSKVEAISGATASQMDALTQKAKEMGATTKFSATESAQAFQYMAMAGWDSAQMIDGIGGIMNLAAADGLDLATTSDIVTDALTAFGLQADDSAHFADVLATASSSANTNVSMLGESFKYVAPVAGAMNYSVEDVSKALGLMANASVKGSMAGTSLKTALSNLAAPTDKMQEAMDKYGISLTDSEGNMKSLDEVMLNLRKSLGDLSEKEQTAAASTIFGKEAMAGMLAIINASEQDYTKLSDAIANADGTAQQMADTMNDNLQGKLTLAKSALEGLGIQFYETVQDDMKKAVEEGTGYVEQLSDAFTNGGLEAAVDEAGGIVADLATKIAQSAPDMVDASTNLIQAFVTGIIKNRKQLKTAAEDVVDALCDGLVKLLPKKMQEPVEKAINSIEKTFKSGMKNILNIGKPTIGALGDLFVKLVDNMDKAIPVTVGLVTAFKGYSIVSDVSKGVKSLSAVTETLTAMEKANALQIAASIGALSGKEMAIGVLTGKVTLATAAQAAWNAVMNANPAALVTTGVIALGAALTAYCILSDDSTEKTGKLSEAQQKTLDSCNTLTEAMEESRSARENNIASIDREYDNYSSLVSELQEITDENGKVKEGYEERAKVITGTLADALGIEIELVGDQVQNYQEVIDTIKEVIVQKKAEAMLSSLQEDMAGAYEKTTQALHEYRDASEVLEEANQNLEQITKEYNQALDDYNFALETGAPIVDQYAQKLSVADGNLKKATASQEEAQAAVDAAQESINGLSAEVDNYNNLMDAMASGETAKIEEAMTTLTTAYTSYSEEALASSQKVQEEMYNQANSYIEDMKLVQDGSIQVADSIYQDMAKAAMDSVAEFNKLPGGVKEGIEAVGPEASAAIVSALAQADLDGKLDVEAQEDLQAFLNGFKGLDSETQEVFSDAVEGALKGLENFDEIKAKADEEGISFLEALAETLEVHSPSRAVKEIFAQVNPGAVEGLNEGKDTLLERSKDVVSKFLESLTGGISEGTPGVIEVVSQGVISAADAAVQTAQTEKEKISAAGAEMESALPEGASSVDTSTVPAQKSQEAVENAANVIMAGIPQIQQAAMEGASAINTGYESADVASGATKTGNESTQALITSLTVANGAVVAASAAVGASASSGLNSVDLSGTFGKQASNATAKLVQSIIESASAVRSAVTSVGKTATSALQSTNMTSNFQTQGKNAISKLCLGIQSQASAASNASRGIGTSVIKALTACNIGTSAQNQGRTFGSSFASGISGQSSTVSGAARTIGSSAQSTLNGYGNSGYSIGVQFSSGFASGIRAGQNGVAAAAAAVANAAANAAKANLQIHSPSRVGGYIGEMFDKGIELNVEKGSVGIEKAVENITDLMKINPAELLASMRGAFDSNINRIVSNQMALKILPVAAAQAEQKTGDVHQVVNFYQETKSPVETSRVLRKEGRRLAFT